MAYTRSPPGLTTASYGSSQDVSGSGLVRKGARKGSSKVDRKPRRPYALRVMVHINLKRATDLLEHATRPDEDSIRVAKEQEGQTAEMLVGDRDGFCFWVGVELLAWAPAYGRSRWLVRSEDGQTGVVGVDRLRLEA